MGKVGMLPEIGWNRSIALLLLTDRHVPRAWGDRGGVPRSSGRFVPSPVWSTIGVGLLRGSRRLKGSERPKDRVATTTATWATCEDLVRCDLQP